MDQIAKAWVDDMKLQENLWHCCYGTFSKDIDWESEYKNKAMQKLKYKYLEDDQMQRPGLNQRGNKGCIAKLAAKVKWDIMKNIKRKVAKMHGMILVSGSAPVILAEYESGETKYKQRKDNAGFNFNKNLHTKVCSH
jgi:hypothetical protein